MPHTGSMGKKLFEIRIKSQMVSLESFTVVKKGKEIVILHSFIEKTDETPTKELEIARKRLQEVERND